MDSSLELDLTLDILPTEILLHIFSYLDAKFIAEAISNVCVKFRFMVNDNSIWKSRIYKRWPKIYPVVPVEEEFDWFEACVQREEQYRLWSDWKKNMKKYHICEAHIAAVDAIQLIKSGSICASGSRDRSLKLWNVKDLGQCPEGELKNALLHSTEEAHQGWIWCISSQDSNLYTGSWDTTVKTWDLGAECSCVETLKFNSAVLCISQHSDLLSVGTYGRNVHLHDTRQSVKSVMQYQPHKKPVLCMAMDEDVIITGSEDGSLAVFDMKASKVRQSLKIDGFPMALSYDSNQLWVGNKHGNVIVFDAREDLLKQVQVFKLDNTRYITGIHHSLGSVILSSRENSICVLEPSWDPGVISFMDTNEEVTCIDVYDYTLASAGCDNSVTFWIPMDEENERCLS